jgi:hypothetical protein
MPVVREVVLIICSDFDLPRRSVSTPLICLPAQV